MEIPKFTLYGENDDEIESKIQPLLSLRCWSELSGNEKQTAFQELKNKGWIESHSNQVFKTIEYLNSTFLRECPGKHLHAIKPERSYRGIGNESQRIKAAHMDFEHIFLHEKSDALVLRMLSKFADCYIDKYRYRLAFEATDMDKRKEYIVEAYQNFDTLSNCLNHIFQQFSVNQLVTRSGFIPRQDEKIIQEVYVPTLHILADPKWKTVSDDLAKTFEDYRDGNFSETITKAHRAVQRFLQILVGEEGKNAKGEVKVLLQKAKEEGLLPINRFTEPFVNLIHSFIVSERATNSTAKPSVKEASSSDAMLMMNLVMIFLQYCLQEK